MAYLHDILIYSPSHEQHLRDIDGTLTAFAKANLLLHPNKCEFGKNKVIYVGLEFSSDGITPSPTHLKAVKTYPEPKNVKQLRCFLGLVNYFRKHIPNRAGIAAQLHALTRKDTVFQWSPKCKSSFDTLKLLLTSAPVLKRDFISPLMHLLPL